MKVHLKTLLFLTTLSIGLQLNAQNIPLGYSCFFEEDFETHDLNYFRQSSGNFYQFHWGSAENDGKDNDTYFNQRFSIQQEANNKYWEVKKLFADKDKDDDPNLNPRSETSLAPSNEWKIQKDEENYFTMSTRLTNPESVNFSAEFCQIMGRNGGIAPPLQLEVKDGVYKARHWIPGTTNGKKRVTILSGHEVVSNDYGQWVKWELYYNLSSDANIGYFKLYKNGTLVWEYYDQTRGASFSNDHWLQYGCYVNNGADAFMQIELDDICLARQTGITNQNPVVSFAEPATGLNLTEDDDLGVIVQASDPDGSIASVDLYLNDVLVRSELVAPYEWGTASTVQDEPLLNLSAGEYTLKAIAIDDLGATSEVTITLTVQEEGVYLLSPIHDAYLQGTTGYNSEDLRIEGGNRVAYLMFDLSNLPDQIIEEASLELTVGTDNGDGTTTIYEGSNSNWLETNLTTSNAPSEGITLTSFNGVYNVGDQFSYSVLNANFSGDQVTFLIKMEAGDNDLAFASKENTSYSGPILRLKLSNEITGLKLKDTYNQLSPNPTSGVVYLNNSGNEKNWSIYSSIGILILEGNNSTIDLTNEANGLYYLKIGSETIKVLKK